MRAMLCCLLIAMVGCQREQETDNPPGQPPTEEELRGSAVTRIDFLRLWQETSGREVLETERDQTVPPLRSGWKYQRRIVAMTKPGKSPRGPDEVAGVSSFTIALEEEIKRLGGSSPSHVIDEHPTLGGVLMSYEIEKRAGKVRLSFVQLKKDDAQVDLVIEALHYRPGKEIAGARGDLIKRTGTALVIHIGESRR
ncbi:MAG: hypothetical protein U0793_05255 [Gemmataceae bacterium]